MGQGEERVSASTEATDRQTDRPSGRHGARLLARGPSRKCGERDLWECQSEFTTVIAPPPRKDRCPPAQPCPVRCAGGMPLLLCQRYPRCAPRATLCAPAAAERSLAAPEALDGHGAPFPRHTAREVGALSGMSQHKELIPQLWRQRSTMICYL